MDFIPLHQRFKVQISYFFSFYSFFIITLLWTRKIHVSLRKTFTWQIIRESKLLRGFPIHLVLSSLKTGAIVGTYVQLTQHDTLSLRYLSKTDTLIAKLSPLGTFLTRFWSVVRWYFKRLIEFVLHIRFLGLVEVIKIGYWRWSIWLVQVCCIMYWIFLGPKVYSVSVIKEWKNLFGWSRNWVLLQVVEDW